MSKARLEKSVTISPVGIRQSRVEEAWDEEWSYNEHGKKEVLGLRGCNGTHWCWIVARSKALSPPYYTQRL